MRAPIWTRFPAIALIVCLLGSHAPQPARADSGVDPVVTIGLLLVVVGVLGWTAWQMEKEDKADAVRMRALLPLTDPAKNTAFGFVVDPASHPDERVIYTAGLAIGRRF